MTPASTPRTRFRERLGQRPLLADGGMGTLMYSRGVPQSACLDELAATRPELVGAAHREYLDAGAELIETLSLGANRRRLAVFGLEGEVGRLNRRAAQVAREAREVSGKDALVGGSVGPLAPPMRHGHRSSEHEARAMFREQLDGLLEGGIDVVVLETFSDLEQLLIALDEARSAADIPVIASLTFGEDLTLFDGATAERVAGTIASAGADVVGVNCGAGPSASIDALKAMGAAGPDDPPRSIMPNAGLPQRLEGRFIYAAGAGYFAQVTPRMVEAGARIVGGCCGTTPEHIASMRAALETLTTTEALRPADRDRAVPGPCRARGPGDTRSRRRPAADPARRAACRPAVRGLGRDRPAAERPHRADHRGRPAAAGRRRRRGERLGLGDGQGADGRVRGRVRDPARPRPRVPRPLHDARPEPDGARIGAARRTRAGGPQHHRPHRRSAAGRRLPDRDWRVGRRLDRPHRHPDAAQPRRGPVRVTDRPAGRLHDRLRARPDCCRRRDRVGPPRTQAVRRRAPGHDPAALFGRAGGDDVRGGAPPLRPGRVPGPGAARRPAARLRAARRVPPQRGARHHDPR